MQHRPAEEAGYQNPLIHIQDGTLAIRRYYFPTGTKRIRLAAISRLEEYPMGKATGRWRTWGSGDLVHWLNLDPRRRHKQQAIYAVNPDGSAVTRLTHAHSEEQEPAFTSSKGTCP
jgi:hypothetical protein